VATAILSPPELLTREQAAEYLGMKPQTLAVWATTHRYDLPMIRVGSRVRYRRSDLDKWLESRSTIGSDE
jgi:excisionase family DNA binding protein